MQTSGKSDAKREQFCLTPWACPLCVWKEKQQRKGAFWWMLPSKCQYPYDWRSWRHRCRMAWGSNNNRYLRSYKHSEVAYGKMLWSCCECISSFARTYLIKRNGLRTQLRKPFLCLYRALALVSNSFISQAFCSAMVMLLLSNSIASSALRKGDTSRWVSI